MQQADVGLIGLAVMGQNLVLNMQDHGFQVAVFNRTVAKVDSFLKEEGRGYPILGAHSLEDFFKMLKRPCKVIFMVKAGEPVDELIAECMPYLKKGDVLIDGGNSLYSDTERRVLSLKEKGIFFMGCGISGGEEGARHGPSIMPGGNPEGWPLIQPIVQSISAKAEEDGIPCCQWVGPGGAGHYVKMVHNGIEYADMQLIAEIYDILRRGCGLSLPDIAEIFRTWNKGPLSSYLIEITAEICTYKEGTDFLLDKILDSAGQKGTGKWTGIEALNLGIPAALIIESVCARGLSSLYDERQKAAAVYKTSPITLEKPGFVETLGHALYAAKIISYAQGFMLMHAAAKEMHWDLNYASIAQIWRAGCIIRSKLLNNMHEAFAQKPNLENLLLAPFFQKEINQAQGHLRQAVIEAARGAIATPCLSSALAFFDGYRAARLPANLIQAQRDFFGAHTYERLDRPRGQFFHTQWSS